MKKIILLWLPIFLVPAFVWAISYDKISDTDIVDSAGDTTVASGQTDWVTAISETPLNAGSDEWFVIVNLQVSVGFTTGTGDAYVHIRKSPDNGSTLDTEGNGTYLGTIECVTGTTITRTFQVYDFDYLDVGLENTDAAQSVTWSAQYDGYKITGLD